MGKEILLKNKSVTYDILQFIIVEQSYRFSLLVMMINDNVVYSCTKKLNSVIR